MIKDLSELQKLLKLCRKQGVTDITLGDVTIKFGDAPKRNAADESDEEPEVETLTPEQLMFYSAGGEQ